MDFYEVKLNSIPKIKFACSVESYNYKNSFPHTPGLIEISVCEEGTILQEYSDLTVKTVTPGMVCTTLKDDTFTSSSAVGVLQKHTTAGIVADYEYKLHSGEKFDLNKLNESVKKNRTILLPKRWNLHNKHEEVTEIIKDISYAHTTANPCGGLNALSKWYHLAEVLTDMVFKTISGIGCTFSLTTENYVNSAKKYIMENKSKSLSVEEIADHIGISGGYLHKIFKEITGMTVIEYINLYKINLVKQYVKSSNISLKEAAYQVGIDDPSYLSRLFKKTAGISFREYCNKNIRL